MLALGTGQPQSTPQRLDDLFRRAGRPALLETGDVVNRDPGQLRELLPAEPGRAWMTADR
jgi:hypothetical protein